jgi:Polyketide cyclase / dehydrase and lipid transport
MNHITHLSNAGLHAVAFVLVFGFAGASAPAAGRTAADSEGYKIMSMQDDLAHRSPNIHWPAGFEPEKADLFAHNELIINASCERIWSHIIDAKRWPSWYPNSKEVEIPGGDPVLRDGTVFRWTTFGLTIESAVHEFVANQRLGWFGYAPGVKPSFYHSWYLEPKGNMCHVVLDEAGVGKDASGLRKSDETLMHRGHDLWLATLKWVAEAK